MNNKGFAITTVLYGLMLLFSMLLISLLSVLSIYRNNLEKLMDSTNGSRDILVLKKIDTITSSYTTEERGLYCPTDYPDTCYYISKDINVLTYIEGQTP